MTYHIVHEYPLQGDGGWDYIAIDSTARRIYASHGDRAEVVDADTGKQVGQILETPDIHGIALATDLHRGFTSNGGDKTVTIFDLATLKTISKVSVNDPDFILYDSFSQRVFPLSETTSVIDARTGAVLKQIELQGEPEGGVSDGKGSVYVNLKNKNAVAVIDAKQMKISRTLPVENCQKPHSLTYDDANERLFVGCRNSGLAVVDVKSGKTVGWALLCSGVDAGAYDPDSKLIYESCSEGVISVIQQFTPDFYRLVDTVKTQIYAKTMTLDTKSKQIYLPVANLDVVLAKEGNDDPKMRVRAGSFRILVVTP
jgi:DNA-binding beta-propeller fold protein YncE